MKKWYYASATIMGTVIGAGVLGIPFVFAKAGILYGILNILIVGAIMTFVNLSLGEVMLRTKGIHQLSGYAEKYLGKKGKILMSLSLIFAIYGALTAYLLGLGQIVSSLFGGQPFFYITIFFVVFAGIIYYGIKSVSRSELLLSSLKIAIFLAMIISLIAFLKAPNLTQGSFSVGTFFLPYGIALFALLGFPSLPEAREVLKGHEKELKKTILVSMLIPIVLYITLAIFFMAALGSNITEVASVSLEMLGVLPYLLGFGFSFLCLTTPFISLGLAVQEMYEYDYKIKHNLAFLMTVAVPYILILLGVSSFVKTLSLVGAVAGGTAGIMIILMFHRAKTKGDRTPEYSLNKNWILGWIVMAALAAGIIYEIIFIF